MLTVVEGDGDIYLFIKSTIHPTAYQAALTWANGCVIETKFPLTAALCGLLHRLAPQPRFPALQTLVNVRDGWSRQVGHGA